MSYPGWGAWGGYYGSSPTPPQGTPVIKAALTAKEEREAYLKTARGWLETHRAHGKEPYYECKIGVYHRWRCKICHDLFTMSDDEAAADPRGYSGMPK